MSVYLCGLEHRGSQMVSMLSAVNSSMPDLKDLIFAFPNSSGPKKHQRFLITLLIPKHPGKSDSRGWGVYISNMNPSGIQHVLEMLETSDNLTQWFPNFSMHQNHLEGLLNYRLMGFRWGF